jgi:uncharacterized protein (TIGR03435 family)
MPVRTLITYAFDVFDFQIVDEPGWTTSERFDIEATYQGGFRNDRMMVQALLRERFALRTRLESREMPVYVLTHARADRRLGPNLRRFTGECPAGRVAFENGGCSARFNAGAMQARGIPWGFLSDNLPGSLGRLVRDETGISGPVEMTLEWTPDLSAAQAAGGGVDIFTAVQEQLGLRLIPGRGPVDVIVVESVSRPTPN